MGTVFVAYGGDGRETVLEFAAERASESDDDLLVYHVQELAEEDRAAVREEIEAVIDRVAPDVSTEITVEGGKGGSDDANVSSQKRLLDAVQSRAEDLSYVVMGNVEHGTVERLALPSMTEAVLDLRSVPVMLVPV